MDNAADTHQSQVTDTTSPATSKRWHAPKYVVIDVNETATDFISVTDGATFFS
jgi:hypothetical protein